MLAGIALGYERFRGRKIAAPLKLLFRAHDALALPEFPRSKDRGPIEALMMPLQRQPELRFRGRKIAAPLKHGDCLILFPGNTCFRGRKIAAPLKLDPEPYGFGHQIAVSAVERSRPH